MQAYCAYYRLDGATATAELVKEYSVSHSWDETHQTAFGIFGSRCLSCFNALCCRYFKMAAMMATIGYERC